MEGTAIEVQLLKKVPLLGQRENYVCSFGLVSWVGLRIKWKEPGYKGVQLLKQVLFLGWGEREKLCLGSSNETKVDAASGRQ